MALSIPEICNMALAAIGHSRFIDNINEGSHEADVCKLFYNAAKQELLRDCRPNWARQWAKLALVAERPNSEWLYAYRLPANALKVLYVPSSETRMQRRVPYAVGAIDQTQVIYTNQSDADAVIVADANEAFFDPTFSNVLALHLATKIAMPLSVDAKIQRSVDERYLYARSMAMAAIANEEQLHPEPESERVMAAMGYENDHGVR